MSDNITLRRAQAGDLDTVVAILEEASAWLHTCGITGQWPLVFERDMVGEGIEAGEVYLAYRGGVAVGAFRLQWSATEVWGDRPDDACYIHSLAIRRSASGRGVGRELLRLACELTVAACRRYLRLDCWAKNEALCRYYEWAGFSYCGRVEFPNGWACALFERACTEIDQ